MCNDLALKNVWQYFMEYIWRCDVIRFRRFCFFYFSSKKRYCFIYILDDWLPLRGSCFFFTLPLLIFHLIFLSSNPVDLMERRYSCYASLFSLLRKRWDIFFLLRRQFITLETFPLWNFLLIIWWFFCFRFLFTYFLFYRFISYFVSSFIHLGRLFCWFHRLNKQNSHN